MKKLLTPLLMLLTAFAVSGQPTVTGPTCVVPATMYEYLITGSWDSGATMQVCVNGAVLAQTSGTCTANGSPLSYVLLQWNPGITAGAVNISSSPGSASLSVTVTTSLKPGSIETSSQLQNIGFRAVPAIIHCNPDTGGSCKPVYTHQWQQSLDNTHWTDVSQATGGDLTIGPAQEQAIFFRRKTIETSSGTVGYSNLAVVQVGPPPPGTMSLATNGANSNE